MRPGRISVRKSLHSHDYPSRRQALGMPWWTLLLLFFLASCSKPADPPRLASTPGAVNNVPPSAFFTYICTNLDCDFDAGASSDSDGGIVSYDWDFDDGTGSGLLSSHSFSGDGSYTVILTVSDTGGATSSASQTLFVTSGNAPPSSAFSSNCPDLSCSFDASASTDDGAIVDFDWDFGDGNIGSGLAPVHSYSVDGTYLVVLTVTDDQGASSTSSKSVTVSAGGGGNDSPNAVFNAACTDLSCNFDASASTDDVGIVAYDWNFGDGNNGSGVTINHAYALDADPFQLAAVVTRPSLITVTATQPCVDRKALLGARLIDIALLIARQSSSCHFTYQPTNCTLTN